MVETTVSFHFNFSSVVFPLVLGGMGRTSHGYFWTLTKEADEVTYRSGLV